MMMPTVRSDITICLYPIGALAAFQHKTIPAITLFFRFFLTKAPNGYRICDMNTIGLFIKQKRKEAGLTQAEFAMRAGLGLRFVRDLEQGKETVLMDKVNQALAMFGMKAVPGRMDE